MDFSFEYVCKKIQLHWIESAIIFWTAINTLSAAISVLTYRGFYADGAHLFLQALVYGWGDDAKRQRFFIDVINQLPLHLARHLPDLDYSVAAYLFNIPLFFLPVILPALAAWIVRKTKPGFSWVFLIFQTAFIMPSLLFAVNPGLTFLALVILNTALLLEFDDKKNGQKIVLLLLALIFFHSHETTLYLMPLLAFYTLWRFRSDKSKFWLILAGLYGANTVFSYWWQTAPHIQNSPEQYHISLMRVLEYLPQYIWKRSLLFSFGLLLLCLVGLAEVKVKKHTHWWLTYLFICLVAAWRMTYILINGYADLGFEYDLRVLLSLGALFLTMLLFTSADFFKEVFKSKALGISILSITILANLWQIHHSIRWSIFYNSTARYLNHINVSKTVDLTQITAQEYQTNWAWPVFSMVIQKGKIKHILYPPKLLETGTRIKLPSYPGDTLETPHAIWQQTPGTIDLSRFEYEWQTKVR